MDNQRLCRILSLAGLWIGLTISVSCKQKNRALEPLDQPKVQTESSSENATAAGPGISTQNIDVFAVIESAPSGISRASKVSIRIAGTGIDEFIYKIGPSVTTECGLGIGYTLHPTGDLDLDLNTLPDGELRLCVVGKHETGVWQEYENASSVTWIKETGQLPVPEQFNQVSAAAKISLFWDAVAGAEGYLLTRSQIPHDWIPTPGESYEIGSPTEGVEIVQANSELSYIDEDVVDANSYHYVLFAFDIERKYSAPLKISAIPGAEPFAWIEVGPGAFTDRAVAAGTRFDGSRNLYICRGQHRDAQGVDLGLHPGKFVPKAKGDLSDGDCYFPYGTETFSAESFQLLVITRGSFDDWFSWAPMSANSNPPETLFAAGSEPPEQNLFSCRFNNGADGYQVVGKTLIKFDGLIDTCQADIFPTQPTLGAAPTYEVLLRKQP